ncbi:MAG: hypothetical protein BWX84_01606 [Verrucomicrobia bacterium ADurb.Bin118]|nr:MAG: hypothetical protein BWX84_01606 [Verrucomicrobia bacterium ADurb.Bin118]
MRIRRFRTDCRKGARAIVFSPIYQRQIAQDMRIRCDQRTGTLLRNGKENSHQSAPKLVAAREAHSLIQDRPEPRNIGTPIQKRRCCSLFAREGSNPFEWRVNTWERRGYGTLRYPNPSPIGIFNDCIRALVKRTKRTRQCPRVHEYGTRIYRVRARKCFACAEPRTRFRSKSGNSAINPRPQLKHRIFVRESAIHRGKQILRANNYLHSNLQSPDNRIRYPRQVPY